MDTHIHTGPNRTGISVSPIDAKEMIAASAGDAPPSLRATLVPIRESYLEETGTVGSVPVPASVKGVLKTGASLLKGEHPAIFIDKLGERLAFERSGVRLYQAMLEKCAVSALLPEEAVQKLRHFQHEELEHFEMLSAAMKSIGADPTAQTPGADLAGVESQGLVQAITDPRATIDQALHVLLAAEALDAPGWEDLIALAKALGHDTLADQFANALSQENIHLATIHAWYSQLTLSLAQKGQPALKMPL